METLNGRRLLFFIAVTVAATILFPQSAKTPATKKAPDAKSAPAPKGAAAAKTPGPAATSRPSEPSPLTPHWLVDVHLKNGAVFHGVAMDGRIHERSRGAAYDVIKESEKDTIGAGIRLWFYRKLDGFTFLSYRFIDHVEKKKQLTEADMTALRDEVRANRQAAAAGNGKAGAPGQSAKATSGWEALDLDQRKLLETYPPSAGWTTERYEAVQKQFVLDGVAPTPDEDEWITVYPEWVDAYRVYNGEEAAGDAAPKAGPKAGAAPKSGAAKTPAPAAPKASQNRPAPTNAKKSSTPATAEPSEPPAQKKGRSIESLDDLKKKPAQSGGTGSSSSSSGAGRSRGVN